MLRDVLRDEQERNDEPVTHRTQEHVALLLGCDRSFVGQVERRALRKLRAAIEREAAAAGLSVAEWLGTEV